MLLSWFHLLFVLRRVKILNIIIIISIDGSSMFGDSELSELQNS